jgi:hypothetical protein
LASRAANLGQTAALMAYVGSYLRDRKPPAAVAEPATDAAGRVEWRRLRHDLPYVYRYLWGEKRPEGSWRPGLNLAEAYQAWLRAAGQAARDPRGASAVMELCRQRMAACAGGPELLRVYVEQLYAGVGRVEAMRRAWTQTEAARQFTGRAARRHGGAARRSELPAPGPGRRNLPVPAAAGPAGQREAGRAAGGPGPQRVVVEAAQLLGVPEVTVPQLREVQHRLGAEAERDGVVLARRWLADARTGGRMTQAQHDAWLAQVEEARRSPEHARWRADHRLAGRPDPAAARAPAAAGAVPDEQGRDTAATADHLAGHAGQHHRGAEQTMGEAVDDPATPVDEQDLFRQRAHTERGLAERYEHQAAAEDGLRVRAVAARPSPVAVVRAARPPDLAGKRPARLVAAQPVPARPPVPGR